MHCEKNTCGKNGFNYCKWAKTIVAIPTLPIVALIAASFFSRPLVQAIAGLLAVIITIKGAIWLDNIQILQKKICKSKENNHA